MKINELLVENEQLDELSLKGLGTGLGKAIGGAAGGVVQGAKNIWTGMKQGYAGAQQALAPDDAAAGGTATAPAATGGAPAATAPASSGATGGPGEVAGNNLLARAQQGTTQDPALQGQQPAPADDTADKGFGFDGHTGKPFASQQERDGWFKANNKVDPKAAGQTPPATPPAGQTPPAGGEAPNPAADQQSKIGVGQINKIIPTLRTRDLNSVKKNVDATIAKKAKTPAAPAAAPAQQPAATPTKPAAPTQAEIDADRERLMGPDNGGANESRVIKFRSRFLGMDI